MGLISKVYNLNCLELMPLIPDLFFDLAIVDPPYGIGEDGRNNASRSKICKAKDYSSNSRYDNEIPPKEYFDELFRISKNQIIWGGNYFIEHLYNTSCFIVWDKDNGGNDFADCELAWTSFDTSVRKFKYRWNGMLQENMGNKEIRIHPNQKPKDLYIWLLQKYAKEGNKILDTHLGSGNSRIACYDLDFDFYGFEIDEHYFNESKKRFQQYLNSKQLFSKEVNTNQSQIDFWKQHGI